MSSFFNNLTNNNYYTYFVIAAACIAVVIILYLIFKSPYKYPYFIYNFDVSGKRNPDIGDLIDEFIINGNYFQIENHNVKIQHWKNDCQKRISKS